MSEIEHDGKTYILKTTVENIIKDRLSKPLARAVEAEKKLQEQTEKLATLEKKEETINSLNTKIVELEKAHKKTSDKFARYTSISSYGLTDPELVDAIEWSFDRAMSKKTDKEKIELSQWLKNAFENPETAPIMLRPHIKQAKADVQATPEITPEIKK